MTLTIIGGQLLVSFFTIFLRGIQTQNVVHGEYKMAAITSCLMSLCNVAFIGMVVADPWVSLLPSMVGGTAGVLLAMKLKRKKVCV